jgi:hypothetical protein
MLQVLLDTSIYHHDPQRRHAGFQTLTALCEERAVTLHIPSIVKREFITHFAGKAESRLSETLGKVNRLSRADGPAEATAVVDRVLTELTELTGKYEKYVEESFLAWLNHVNAVVHEIRPEGVHEIFDRYFSGDPPFRKVKNRDDFPDAFIWQIINDISSQHDKLFVVVADGDLRGATASIPKVEVFDSLDAFIESEVVQDLLPENFARNHADEILRIFESDEEFMKQALLDAASAEIVNRVKLPHRDDEDADVYDISEVTQAKFDFALARYYGQNIFRVPFEAELEATLDYFLMKSTYFEMPDIESEALGINDSDWNPSYMWVEESCALEINGMLAIAVDVSQVIADSSLDTLDEASVKDYAEVTIDDLRSIKLKDVFAD